MGKSQDETLPKPLPGTGDQAESDAIYEPLDGTGEPPRSLFGPDAMPKVGEGESLDARSMEKNTPPAAPGPEQRQQGKKTKVPDVDWGERA